jgi:23S rRNA (cytidine1920-2'-O)/16S rRNA (cytidine1409-2'-O)-methyltransferase
MKPDAKKERIDKLLVDLGLADSRTKAQALVMAGVVLANEKRIEKVSHLVDTAAAIRLKGAGPESRYVSRGGLKLEHALREFRIDPKGFVCIDIGSSTGGFTDCLLQQKAAKVVAIDSGTNQMVWSLRSDERVDLRENTNARFLKPDDFDRQFDLGVVDVSFISLTKVLPAIVPLIKPNGCVVALIKPQFEVGRFEVGKGGIVRETEKHERVVNDVNAFAVALGLKVSGAIDSPILGAEGNKEFLAQYEKETDRLCDEKRRPLIEGTDFYYENGLMVLTAEFLSRRGCCCGSQCRHCPFGHINVPDHSR